MARALPPRHLDERRQRALAQQRQQRGIARGRELLDRERRFVSIPPDWRLEEIDGCSRAPALPARGAPRRAIHARSGAADRRGTERERRRIAFLNADIEDRVSVVAADGIDVRGGNSSAAANTFRA